MIATAELCDNFQRGCCGSQYNCNRMLRARKWPCRGMPQSILLPNELSCSSSTIISPRLGSGARAASRVPRIIFATPLCACNQPSRSVSFNPLCKLTIGGDAKRDGRLSPVAASDTISNQYQFACLASIPIDSTQIDLSLPLPVTPCRSQQLNFLRWEVIA